MSELFGWLKINLIYRIPMGFRKMVRLESGDAEFSRKRMGRDLLGLRAIRASIDLGSDIGWSR